MQLLSVVGFTLSLYAGVNVARPLVTYGGAEAAIQIKHTTPWALRADNCPADLVACSLVSRDSYWDADFHRRMMGQDACCPPRTTCVRYILTGSVACCPYGNRRCSYYPCQDLVTVSILLTGCVGDNYCGGLGTENTCADPSWTLMEGSKGHPFCCLPGQVGTDLNAEWKGGHCADPAPFMSESGSRILARDNTTSSKNGTQTNLDTTTSTVAGIISCVFIFGGIVVALVYLLIKLIITLLVKLYKGVVRMYNGVVRMCKGIFLGDWRTSFKKPEIEENPKVNEWGRKVSGVIPMEKAVTKT